MYFLTSHLFRHRGYLSASSVKLAFWKLFFCGGFKNRLFMRDSPLALDARYVCRRNERGLCGEEAGSTVERFFFSAKIEVKNRKRYFEWRFFGNKKRAIWDKLLYHADLEAVYNIFLNASVYFTTVIVRSKIEKETEILWLLWLIVASSNH